MSDVDTLRKAAALMRARAQAATPGPYIVSDSNEGSWPPRPGWVVANDAFYNPSDSDDEPWLAVEFHTGIEADARHLGSWPPAVALAVADWLDGLYERITDTDAEDDDLAAALRGESSTEEWPDVHAALAVAHAYLGESS